MLTFESSDESHQLEIHGDKIGLLALAKVLIEIAEGKDNDHRHLMTADWGGSELSNETQGASNELYNHVKILFWPKGELGSE